MPYFTNNNAEIFYTEKGKGDLLIILPGNTATSACHENEIDFFSKNYHVVAIDFRGTGKSTKYNNWGINWWNDCTDDIAALIKHLNKTNCILLGTSGGANIALLFAIKYPKLVKAVIADSCAEKFLPEALIKEVEQRRQKTKEQVEFWQWANGKDWESVVENDNKLLLDFAKAGGDLYKGNLVKINCPVLLTASLKDSFINNIGSEVAKMAKQIKQSQAYLVNEGDHPLIWTAPKKFLQISTMFLKLFKQKG